MVQASQLFGAPAEPGPFIGNYVIDQWDSRRGLANSSVRALAQSPEGYLWVGTAGGLFRFDGLQFTRFDRGNTPGFLSSRVEAVTVTPDGAVWAGMHHGGAHRYHRGVWSHYALDQGLDHTHVEGFLVDGRGTLFAVTAHSLRYFNEGQFHALDSSAGCPESRLDAFGPGLRGDLWLFADGHLTRFRDGKCTDSVSMAGKLRVTDLEPFDLFSHALLETRDGKVWLGSPAGLWELPIDTPGEPRLWLPGIAVPALLEDSQGRLWAGLTDQGLARIEGGRLTRWTQENGLADNRVWALLEGREGAMWVGTYDGLQRLQTGPISTVTEADGLSEPFALSAFERRPGEVWVGHRKGVDRYRDGRAESLPWEPGSSPTSDVARSRVWSFLEDRDGVLWIGTDLGLMHWSGSMLSRSGPELLQSKSVRTLAETADGRLWAGTTRGLFQIDGQAILRRELPDHSILVLYEDSRLHLWAGTQDGLYRIDSEGLSRFPKDDSRNLYIRAIYEHPGGGLWLGTLGHGLQHLNEAGELTEIGRGEGLFDDNVWHLLDDQRGNLWMCSDLGIFTVSMAELSSVVAGELERVQTRVFGLADGMRDLECNGGGQPSSFRSSDHRLWFPTAAGPTIVDVSNLGQRPLAFPTRLESIAVDDLEMDLKATVRMSHRARSLIFRFTAPSLRDAFKLRFRYQLEGYDPEWRPITDRRLAVYGRLPSGSYRFRVEAMGSDGQWAGAVVSPIILVPEPLWRSRWAMLIYTAAFLAALGFFARHQTRRVQVEREMVDKQMKVLQGLLPICAQCKKIREEDGSWTQLETYIDSHSEAAFSHGICPSCMANSFPDVAAEQGRGGLGGPGKSRGGGVRGA